MDIAATYRKNGKCYAIKNADGGEICCFDSLETAGIVLRYLQGTQMPQDDYARAVEAMRGFDQREASRAAERAAASAVRRERALAARAAQEGGNTC